MKKNSYKTINLKYQHQHGMTNLHYLIDHFIIKKHKTLIDNPPIKLMQTKLKIESSFK